MDLYGTEAYKEGGHNLWALKTQVLKYAFIK